MAGFDFTALIDAGISAGAGIKRGQKAKREETATRKRDALSAFISKGTADRDRERIRLSKRRVKLEEEEAARATAELEQREVETGLEAEFVMSQLTPEEQARLRSAGLTPEQIIAEGTTIREADATRASQQHQSGLITERGEARESRAEPRQGSEAQVQEAIQERTLEILRELRLGSESPQKRLPRPDAVLRPRSGPPSTSRSLGQGYGCPQGASLIPTIPSVRTSISWVARVVAVAARVSPSRMRPRNN